MRIKMEIGKTQRLSLMLTILFVTLLTFTLTVADDEEIQVNRRPSRSINMGALARFLFGDMFAPYPPYPIPNYRGPYHHHHHHPNYNYNAPVPSSSIHFTTTQESPLNKTDVINDNINSTSTAVIEPTQSTETEPAPPQINSEPEESQPQTEVAVTEIPQNLISYQQIEPQPQFGPIVDHQFRSNYPYIHDPNQGPGPDPQQFYQPHPGIPHFGHYSGYPGYPYRLEGIFSQVPINIYEPHHGAMKYNPVPPTALPLPSESDLATEQVNGTNVDTFELSTTTESPQEPQSLDSNESPVYPTPTAPIPIDGPTRLRPQGTTINMADGHFVNTNSHFNNNKGFRGNPYDPKPSMAMSPPVMPSPFRNDQDFYGNSLIGRMMSSYMKAFFPISSSNDDDSFFSFSSE